MMFELCVFEIFAGGTHIISNYSKGIERMLGDIVHMVEVKNEVTYVLEI